MRTLANLIPLPTAKIITLASQISQPSRPTLRPASLHDGLERYIPLYAKPVVINLAVCYSVIQRQVREVGCELIIMPGKKPVCAEREFFTRVIDQNITR